MQVDGKEVLHEFLRCLWILNDLKGFYLELFKTDFSVLGFCTFKGSSRGTNQNKSFEMVESFHKKKKEKILWKGDD